jgi:hypothetical protein
VVVFYLPENSLFLFFPVWLSSKVNEISTRDYMSRSDVPIC